MAKIPIDEQETVIILGRDSQIALISTTDTRHMNKFDKLVKNNPSEWRLHGASYSGWDMVEKEYECPINLISFRKATKTISEEQKEAAANRMRQYHAEKKGDGDEQTR